jgi:hypothetical protein
MATLKYVGKSSTGASEVTTQAYVQNLLSGNLTQTQVNNQITTRMADYSTKTYVDSRDALLADSAFIDTADLTRLAKAVLNQPGYPFTVDENGKIPSSKIPGGTLTPTSLQKYPKITAVGTGSGATTTSDTGMFTVTVPDPGYPYRVLVAGTVHGQVASDNGSYAKVSVYRGDDVLVAVGNGIAESYQTPALGSLAGRMYVGVPYTPSYSNAIWTPPPLFQIETTYTSDWQPLTWVGINNDTYTTTMSGTAYMQAASTMSNVTLSASVSFDNGELPPDGLSPSTLTPEIRIYSSAKSGPIASSAIPGNLKSTLGTLTATASNISVTKGDLFSVQVKQTIFAPWGKISHGSFAQWAPSSSGTSNTLTMTPGLAADLSTGEIPILPTALSTQSPITGPTVLSVRLQSSSGAAVSTASTPTPRLTAIPIPA